MKTILHHFAYNITPNNLEAVVELFGKLGCAVTYQQEGAQWFLLGQDKISMRMQVIETNDLPIEPIEKKMNTHVAFLSDSPAEDIDEIEKWCTGKGIRFKRGGWSGKELWFDLPDVFVNFVVEIMHNSVVE